MTEISPEDTEHRFGDARAHRSRTEYLRARSHGRRVLHLGCVDSGFYETHTAGHRFVHDDLIDVATVVIGVDIDRDGIERMRRDGYADLLVADITRDDERAMVLGAVASAGGVDLVICGEVIEHVLNPSALMRALLEVSSQTGAEIIVTTPNPFYWGRFIAAARRRETVHPDHTAYLSAANLAGLARRSGALEYLHIDFYENSSKALLSRGIKHAISAAFPCLADGIIARLKSAARSDLG